MPDLASSDVTITVQKQSIEGKKRRNLVKIQFGNGTLTYPNAAGGVPMPAKGSFGMKQSLDYLIMVDGNDGSGIIWKYDYENKKLRGYIQGVVVSAAGAATIDDFALNTTTDPLASAISLGLSSTAGAGTHYLGAMKELAATAAPVAQVLYAEAVGS